MQVWKFCKALNNEDNRVKIIHLNENSGKGKAINEELKHVSGDIIIIQDDDLEYSPDDYPVNISTACPGTELYNGRRLPTISQERLKYYYNWL